MSKRAAEDLELPSAKRLASGLHFSSEPASVKFMLNVPMFVPANIDRQPDSDSESDDGTFNKKFNFDVANPMSFPYRTFDVVTEIKQSKSKKAVNPPPKIVTTIENKVGILSDEIQNIKVPSVKISSSIPKTNKVATLSEEIQSEVISSVEVSTPKPIPQLQKFLGLLESKGFDADNQSHLSDLAVSVGLNRPESLSERKNNSLLKELQTKETGNIQHSKFGFFLECSMGR